MSNTITINNDVLSWAITRAGYEFSDFIIKFPKIKEWLENKKSPTLLQLEDFAKKVHIPLGYLFLNTLPKEDISFPFFRTGKNANSKTSLNVYDEIILIQRRQEWLSNYLSDNGYDKLPFVSKYSISSNYKAVADDIRVCLELDKNWAVKFDTLADAINFLSDKIEELGIVVVSTGVSNDDNRRAINIEECRGFVLTDNVAPFMFINAKDAKAAQIFSLAHELAHIWIGQSAGFDFKKLMPSNDPAEILCDKIAGELLVPEDLFNKLWKETPDIESISRYFKVSRIVVARRALDLGKITKSAFFEMYNTFIVGFQKENENRLDGGNFYATKKKRVSLRFAAYVKQAVENNQLLYNEAYRLTGLKGDTYQKFMEKYL